MNRLAFTFLVLAIAPAHAQNCAPHERIVDHLKQKYGEQLAGLGVRNANQVIEIWIAPDGGTFTILQTGATGVSCVIASGRSFGLYQQEPSGEDG